MCAFNAWAGDRVRSRVGANTNRARETIESPNNAQTAAYAAAMKLCETTLVVIRVWESLSARSPSFLVFWFWFLFISKYHWSTSTTVVEHHDYAFFPMHSQLYITCPGATFASILFLCQPTKKGFLILYFRACHCGNYGNEFRCRGTIACTDWKF